MPLGSMAIVVAVNDANVHIALGITALLGPHDAGKSATLVYR